MKGARMTKKKVLIVADYVKNHYIGMKNGKSYNRYLDTNEGKFLKSLLLDTYQKVGYDGVPSYNAIFAVPELQKVIKENRKDRELDLYAAPATAKIKEYKESLRERIADYDPDVILVIGSIAVKALFDKGSISSMRTLPDKININGKDYQYFVSYSPAYVRNNPKSLSLAKIDAENLAKYLKNGDESFKKSDVKYSILGNEDADKIVNLLRHITLNYGKTPEHPVAWDYETNSLSGTESESKIITASVSLNDHMGITFPIDHPEKPWSPEDRKKIVDAWLEFVVSPIWKVGHNVSFDMRQTKLVLKPIQFKNSMDTLVAYYVGVSQEVGSRSLKDLALMFTDMGQYDKKLDEFKSWFNTGFGTGKSKELVDKFGKDTFVKKVKKSIQGDYVLTDEDYLDYLTPEQRKLVYNTAKRLLEEQGYPDVVHNEVDPKEKMSYAWIPYEILAYYACGDVDATSRIHSYMWNKYISPVDDFVNLYTNHYPVLMNTLTNMEYNGFALDKDYLVNVRETFKEKIAGLLDAMMDTPEVKATIAKKTELYTIGLEEKMKPVKERDSVKYKYYTDFRDGKATDFDPNKKFDLKYALFGATGYKLPIEKSFIPDATMKMLRNKQITEDDLDFSSYSTGSDAISMLLKLYPDFKLAKYVSEYTRLNKLLTTYTDSLIEKADDASVIHGRFNATGTATTRLSSNNPNMQNISKPSNNPEDIDYDYPIKRAFVPHYTKGQDTIINLDFASQEAHLAAVLADDESMIEAFLNGEDVHKATASLMYNKPVEEVTKDERFSAKSTTFG